MKGLAHVQKQLKRLKGLVVKVVKVVSDPQGPPKINKTGNKGKCLFHLTDEHEIVDCREFAAKSWS